MSLISRKAIQRAGPDKHDEKIITFRKELDKTYTKITKTMSRDWKTGGIKEMKRKPPVEEGPYILVQNEAECDEKMKYEDHEGKIAFMFFKLSEKEGLSEK